MKLFARHKTQTISGNYYVNMLDYYRFMNMNGHDKNRPLLQITENGFLKWYIFSDI